MATSEPPCLNWPPLDPVDQIDSLTRVNAVMHAHAFTNICIDQLAPAPRDMLAGCNTVHRKESASISHFASKTPGSSFDQLSVNCNSRVKGSRVDGVILRFQTDNFIRAGGNDGQNPLRSAGTHVSAFLSVLRFNRLTAKLSGRPLTWIGAAGAPNNVISGNFRRKISDELGKHHRVSHTCKFPGYAVHTGGDGPMRATPEVFLSGKFILPVSQLKCMFKPHLY